MSLCNHELSVVCCHLVVFIWWHPGSLSLAPSVWTVLLAIGLIIETSYMHITWWWQNCQIHGHFSVYQICDFLIQTAMSFIFSWIMITLILFGKHSNFLFSYPMPNELRFTWTYFSPAGVYTQNHVIIWTFLTQAVRFEPV